MRISAKAEYACLTIIELARSQLVGRPMRAREIAESQDIPERYLVQILLQLKLGRPRPQSPGIGGRIHTDEGRRGDHARRSDHHLRRVG
jgi:hypothetical protein